jgi:cytochrome d ubiquinol oxidase subunit II
VFALHADARFVYDGLTEWPGVALVVASGVCGIAALALLARGVTGFVRPLAVGAVVTVIWGYFAAVFPYLLPTSLTISAGAGASATLTAVIVVAGAAALTVVPSLALLYVLSQRSALE